MPAYFAGRWAVAATYQFIARLPYQAWRGPRDAEQSTAHR